MSNLAIKNIKPIIFVFIAAAFMSSCMPSHVKSNVSSFSSLTSINSGDPFYVLPGEAQASSAEFNQYASSISRRLERKGWRRVSQIEQARYVVLIDYGVTGSSTKVSSLPIFGQTGGGSTTHSGTFNAYGSSNTHGIYSGTSYSMPTWGVVGSQTVSATTHQRYFQMKVIDKATENPVYETKAASEGSSATFGMVAECVFDLALAEFPMSVNKNGAILMDNCGQ